MSRRILIVAFLLLFPIAACGGDDDETPAADLTSRLLPENAVSGFDQTRSFQWDNAIDFVVQGVFISQNSKPSEVIGVVEDAGFEGAAGQQLSEELHGPAIFVLAAEFASDSGAEDVQARLHQEDLIQPCYGACSQIQSDLDVSGIPDAAGAQSVPDPKPPPDAPPPFEAYSVEFTIGSNLYLVSGNGPANAGMKDRVLDAATALYERVKDSDD